MFIPPIRGSILGACPVCDFRVWGLGVVELFLFQCSNMIRGRPNSAMYWSLGNFLGAKIIDNLTILPNVYLALVMCLDWVLLTPNNSSCYS